MPLGDSITKGHGTCSDPANQDCTGYREPLYDLLVNAGYAFDFVGSLGAEFQANHDFDTDHEGHGGFHANQIRSSIFNGFGPNPQGENWIVEAQPHVVLLHIGTNDISSGDPPLQVMGETNTLLDEIDEYENETGRKVHVILAQIVNRHNPNSPQGMATSELNNRLADMVSTRRRNGDLITLVDMEHALNYPADLDDGLHPNQSGYTKMAGVWFTALQQVWADACP